MKTRILINVLFTMCSVFLVPCLSSGHTPRTLDVEVCVYGANAGGILSAISAKKEGRSVVIVEPGRWVGGMLGCGIKPQQDCPNLDAVGGMSRTLLETLGGKDKGLENREINPKDVRQDFLELVEDYDIEIIYDHRIGRCEKKGLSIEKAFFDYAPYDETGLPPERAIRRDSITVAADIFIDCSYEGDLFYRADVSYRTGRESRLDFDEPSAGVTKVTEITDIDPFVEKGNPESGLLPMLEYDHGKGIGAGDRYTQAFNFRYYITDDPDHRLAIDPPAGYDPFQFELVGRYVEHLKNKYSDEEELSKHLRRIWPGWMNDGDYNYQRHSLVSIAPLGRSHILVNGDYATKARVWKEHRDYLKGLYTFMKTDPRVPERYRREITEYGLDIRPHEDSAGWPFQLYIRVARRMIGEYTITENDVYNRTEVSDPIGLAQYGIDTYPCRRVAVKDGDDYSVGLEGWMFVGGVSGPTKIPYPISYRCITPLRNECDNLFVPVLFSATHLGYASARMEPVFMICGESAGVAADLALDGNTSVQDVDRDLLKQRLLERKQLLSWPVTE